MKGSFMLKRYKVKLFKKYDFELDGISEEDVLEQVNYIMYKTNILDMPYVNKRIKINVKKQRNNMILKNKLTRRNND